MGASPTANPRARADRDDFEVEVETVAELRERDLSQGALAVDQIATVEVGHGQAEDPALQHAEGPVAGELVQRHAAGARLSAGDARALQQIKAASVERGEQARGAPRGCTGHRHAPRLRDRRRGCARPQAQSSWPRHSRRCAGEPPPRSLRWSWPDAGRREPCRRCCHRRR